MSDKVEHGDVNGRLADNVEPNGEPTCKINFENNPNRVYYTGQLVTGCVNLSINETTAVRAIYANVFGRGCSMLRTYTGSSSGEKTTISRKEEIYMNRKIYYIGSQNSTSAGRITVQPGDYKYSFDCNIPDECHTSVEDTDGFIRYSVIVVIEEDVDRKKEFVESFTVINPLNLNDDETYSYPMSDEAEFTFEKYCCCLCCWMTEPVKFSVKVPKKGYAPGQAIEITINVDNKSNQTYNNFIANIFKNIDFYANNNTSTSTEKLSTVNCEGCPAGQSLSRKLIIAVPSTPRTEASSIHSISYLLTVEAFADCCRDDLKLEFPLTIGTYPIQNTNTQVGDIVVTQQPTRNGQETQFHNNVISQHLQMQPLLNDNSQDNSMEGTSSAVNDQTSVSPDFRVGESSRSDKDLENSYRPMYPMYMNTQYPLACSLKVEAEDVKLIKM